MRLFYAYASALFELDDSGHRGLGHRLRHPRARCSHRSSARCARRHNSDPNTHTYTNTRTIPLTRPHARTHRAHDWLTGRCRALAATV